MKMVSLFVATKSALFTAVSLCIGSDALAASGSVSGIVQNATMHQPLTNGSVSLTINGQPWGTTAPVDGSGGFSFGTVVWAVGSSATCQLKISGSGLVDGSASDTLSNGGSIHEVINRAGSTISGTVTDSLTASPISSGSVLVYDSGGVLLGAATEDPQGQYRFGGLPSGTYYLRTDTPDYLDELWSNIPCTNGNCSVTSGMPVPLPDQVSNSTADFQIESNLIFSDNFGG